MIFSEFFIPYFFSNRTGKTRNAKEMKIKSPDLEEIILLFPGSFSMHFSKTSADYLNLIHPFTNLFNIFSEKKKKLLGSSNQYSIIFSDTEGLGPSWSKTCHGYYGVPRRIVQKTTGSIG